MTWQPDLGDDAPWVPPEPPEQLLAGPVASVLGASASAAKALLRSLWEGDVEEAEIEDKAFSDCRYLSCKNVGLSLRLRPPGDMGRVDVAFLYGEGADGYSAYSAGPLPAGLAWGDRSRGVVVRLGEPSDKFGGGRIPTGIAYETLGLDVHFQNCSWEDASNPIKFLSLYVAVDQSLGMCAKCAKQAKFRCSQCRRCSYCSSACQKEDWARHKEACASLSACTSMAPARSAAGAAGAAAIGAAAALLPSGGAASMVGLAPAGVAEEDEVSALALDAMD